MISGREEAITENTPLRGSGLTQYFELQYRPLSIREGSRLTVTWIRNPARHNRRRSSDDGLSSPLEQASSLGDSVLPGSGVVGRVGKVLPQSFVDGPGNRAVVFLQGCNLRCLFCHNPQTLAVCNSCGVCIDHCPTGALTLSDDQIQWDPDLCEECDTCIRICPNFSSPQVRHMTARQLWLEIEPLSEFLSGVTVSGGEPTQQMEFLVAFLDIVKQSSDLSTFIETNGCVSTANLQMLLPVLDGAMIDLKAMDPDVHRELTGQGNTLAKQAIRFLADNGKAYAVRVTVVPGFNDNVENAVATARFLTKIDRSIRLRFLRFRAHGTRGLAETWESPSEELMNRLVEAARAEGLLNVSRSI